MANILTNNILWGEYIFTLQKKMSKLQTIGVFPEPQVLFQPAVLKRNKSIGYYIEFYIHNSTSGKLDRQRIKLNRYRNKYATAAEFNLFAHQQLLLINSRLQQLHTVQYPAMPIYTQETPKPQKTSGITLTAALNKYKNNLSDLRPGTIRSYNTFISQLDKWVRKNFRSIKLDEFGKREASMYIEYVHNGGNSRGRVRQISARTYNNNLKFCRILFGWFVEHAYIDENPFERIKTKKEHQKQRTIIPPEIRRQIREYFTEKLPPYLIICELTYSSLLRPVEISRLQVDQIDYANHCIHMPGTKTKNHCSRDARLSPELEELLRKHTLGANPSDYLFADRLWKCGKKPMASHTYGNVWTEMRRQLNLPQNMQLYSLRDSGINNMLKSGIDPLSVMQAADHHDLSMTTRYANHTDTGLIEKLNQKAPDF